MLFSCHQHVAYAVEKIKIKESLPTFPTLQGMDWQHQAKFLLIVAQNQILKVSAKLIRRFSGHRA